MIIKPDSCIVFCGDSVTDFGRTYDAIPAGWGSFGNGYVRDVNSLLASTYPEAGYMVVNRGVSGNDIRLMDERWDKDVLALRPDWISVMIGVNDAWRHFDGQFRHPGDRESETAAEGKYADIDRARGVEVMIYPDEFRRRYESILTRTRAALPDLQGITVMGPYFADLDRGNPMRRLVERFAAIARDEAGRNGCRFVDTQAAVDRFLHVRSSYSITQDRVHPNDVGHMLLARQWLASVGFDWGHGLD